MIPELHFCSHRTNPASVGVDDSAADCDPSGETEVVGSFFAEGTDKVAGTEIFAILTVR